MNLLRPLDNTNDPVWSVIISNMILDRVAWVIRYILLVDTREAQDHSDDTPKSEELLQLRVIKIIRFDGDTIDVTIDLGFDLGKKERVRVAGVDTPEKRTRDKEERN